MMWVHQYPHVSSISSTYEPFVPPIVRAQRAHTQHMHALAARCGACVTHFFCPRGWYLAPHSCRKPAQPPPLEGDGSLLRQLRSFPRAGGWGKRGATPALQKRLPPTRPEKMAAEKHQHVTQSRHQHTRALCSTRVERSHVSASCETCSTSRAGTAHMRALAAGCVCHFFFVRGDDTLLRTPAEHHAAPEHFLGSAHLGVASEPEPLSTQRLGGHSTPATLEDRGLSHLTVASDVSWQASVEASSCNEQTHP